VPAQHVETHRFGAADPHTHAPFVQVLPVGQTVPQAPQFCSSVAVSVQAFPQSSCEPGHWHEPPLQTRPPVHVVPHAPQFRASVAVFTQVVGEIVGHGVGADEGHWHEPDMQTSFVSGQALPQAPGAAGPQF
jgi:hypothetical protein